MELYCYRGWMLTLQCLRDELSFWMMDKVSTLQNSNAEVVEDSFSEIQNVAKDLKALFDTLEDE